MSKSKITWTDEVWNIVTGCTKVSQGCKNCYAEREWPRLTRLVPSYAGRDFTDVRTHADRLDQPLRWKRPRRIFINSMSDLFHSDVPDAFIDRVFAVMALAPQHTFQVLTKRAARMRIYITHPLRHEAIMDQMNGMFGVNAIALKWPLPNVWLGVSVEDQATADERIPLLLQTPSAVRWISAEPLLGPVSLDCWPIFGEDEKPMLNWMVVGGESGPNARPMHPQWARDLRDQCASAGVPFLFKQWGEWGPAEVTAGGDLGGDLRRGTVQHLHAPGNPEGYFRAGDAYVRRVGKKVAGRLLDGAQHDGYPVIQGGDFE